MMAYGVRKYEMSKTAKSEADRLKRKNAVKASSSLKRKTADLDTKEKMDDWESFKTKSTYRKLRESLTDEEIKKRRHLWR
jgi:hypothetical protein